jgi:hypothetical protein
LITCFLRYTIDPDKLDAFEHYARVWMRLIGKYGGTHHGYFVPGEGLPTAAFSFPGIGEEGPGDIAVASFSFPTVEAYETYRREVATDSRMPRRHEALRTNTMLHKIRAHLSASCAEMITS